MADLARVRRNVDRMVRQGAPEADIDAYLSTEGTTPEALRAFGQSLKGGNAPGGGTPAPTGDQPLVGGFAPRETPAGAEPYERQESRSRRQFEQAQGLVRRFMPGSGIEQLAGAANAAPRDLVVPNLAPEEAPQGWQRHAHTFRNTLMPGGNRIAAATTAAVAKGRGLTPWAAPGDERGFGEIYDQALAGEFARTNAIDESKGLPDHAAVAAGILAGAGLLKRAPGMAPRGNPAVGRGYTPVPGAPAAEGAVAPTLLETGKDLARVGAGYGMLQGWADSQSTSPVNRLMEAAIAAGGGAVLGPAIGGAVKVVGDVAGAPRDFVNRLFGASPERRASARATMEEMQAIGIRDPSALALAESPAQRMVGRSVATSVFGRPLADDAARTVADARGAVDRTLARRTDGTGVNDNIAAVQRSLDQNLTQRSRSSADIEGASYRDLEGMTGPYDPATGFRPPRPIVDPVPPAYMPDVAARRVDPAEVPVPHVEPSYRAPPIEAVAKRVEPENVSVPWEALAARNKAVGEMEVADAQLRAEWDRFRGLLRDRHGEGAAAMEQRIAELLPISGPYRGELEQRRAYRAKYGPPPGGRTPVLSPEQTDAEQLAAELAAYRRLIDVSDGYRRTKSALDTANDAYRGAEVEARLQATRQRGAAVEQAMQSAAREQQRLAEAEARRAAQDLHGRRVSERQAQLDREASDSNARSRQRADREAQAETERRQAAADREWETTPSSFALGRSRETYPTEISAAEEVVSRQTPPLTRNPLGGDPKAPTNTERLLDRIGQELRNGGLLPGYRDGEIVTGLSPEMAAQLRRLLGQDVGSRIIGLIGYRGSPEAWPGGYRGMRQLMTVTRRAAEDAEKADRRFPTQGRLADAAALRRLQQALTDDLRQFMREQGPEGQAALRTMDDVRRVEARHQEETRRPLVPLFRDGEERVPATDATARLATALQQGDMQVIRPLMRVLREKADGRVTPEMAVATVLQHMSSSGPDGGTLRGFLSVMRGLRPEVRRELRGAPGSARLIDDLERLEQVLPRIEALERRVGGTGDTMQVWRLANTQNVGLAAFSAFTQHWPLVATYTGGVNLTARLMASPAYRQWLTRLPSARTPADLTGHMKRLAVLAGDDTEVSEAMDRAAGAALDAVLPGKAKAAGMPPDLRRPREPYDYRPGGDDPGIVRTPDPEQPLPNIEMTPDLARPPMPEPPGKMPRFGRAPDGAPVEPVLFAGERAATADREALARAKAMQEAGRPMDEVWRTTGWLRAPDGKWRSEIDDSGMRLGPMAAAMVRARAGASTLGEVIDHEQLFAAYPQLRSMRVEVDPEMRDFASYDWGTRTIAVGKRALAKPSLLADSILHEIQHRLQHDERFAYGSPKATDPYERRPGEVEASEVERRRRMTSQERRQRPPDLAREGSPAALWPGAAPMNRVLRRKDLEE